MYVQLNDEGDSRDVLECGMPSSSSSPIYSSSCSSLSLPKSFEWGL